MDLNQITLPCNNYDASVKFYEQLGLRLIVNSPPRYARFETPAGTTLSIHASEVCRSESAVVVYFEVEDVDSTVADLTSKGLAFDSQPTDQEWLWREAHLQDPFGNRVCIYHAGKNRRYPPWRVSSK